MKNGLFEWLDFSDDPETELAAQYIADKANAILPEIKELWLKDLNQDLYKTLKCFFCGKDNLKLCRHGFCSMCGCKNYCWLD